LTAPFIPPKTTRRWNLSRGSESENLRFSEPFPCGGHVTGL
jgi:hypothetical protein